jgi:hypothetical protein
MGTRRPAEDRRVVLMMLALGIVGYFVWNRWWPERPHRVLKILCVVAAIVIVAHIASPIADLIRAKATVIAQPASVDQKKAP